MLKALIIILFIIAVILLWESEREKKILSVETVTISSDKIRNNKRLVYISDLHDAEFGKDNTELINKISENKPDYILFGGDILITKKGKTDLRVLENLLKECIKIAPVIYANGNHEQRLFYKENQDTYGRWKEEFLKLINKYEVTYISNSHIELDDICVYGLDIPEESYTDVFFKKLEDGYILDKLKEADQTKFNILLAHSPLFLDRYEKWGADLGLCGHFHGGVMRIGKQGVLTSQWHPFHRWCVGRFKINKSDFIVSRGLGGHTINVRINNLPELTVINIINKG